MEQPDETEIIQAEKLPFVTMVRTSNYASLGAEVEDRLFREFFFEEQSDEGYLVPTTWTQSIKKALIKLPYGSQAHQLHINLVSNDISFEGLSEQQSKALQQACHKYLDLSGIVSTILIEGGIAFWIEINETPSSGAFEDLLKDIQIISLERVQSKYDTESQEIGYEVDGISLSRINEALEKAGQPSVPFVSKMGNFHMGFLQTDPITKRPISFYSAFLEPLYNEAGFQMGIAKVHQQNGFLKVAKLYHPQNALSGLQSQLEEGRIQAMNILNQAKKMPSLVNGQDRGENASDIIDKKLVEAGSLTCQGSIFVESGLDLAFESTIESAAHFTAINDVVTRLIPSALKVPPKLLNLDASSPSLNQSEGLPMKAFIDQELTLIQSVSNILSGFFRKILLVMGVNAGDDFQVVIEKPKMLLDLIEHEEITQKEGVIALKLDNLQKARLASIEVPEKYKESIFQDYVDSEYH